MSDWHRENLFGAQTSDESTTRRARLEAQARARAARQPTESQAEALRRIRREQERRRHIAAAAERVARGAQ